MDWHSCRVVIGQLADLYGCELCVKALRKALEKIRHPRDLEFEIGVKVSMDGRGRWIVDRMIERLWRLRKDESVCLNAFETGSEARKGIGDWISHQNQRRPYSAHDLPTPAEVYDTKITAPKPLSD
jgi:putative transposase